MHNNNYDTLSPATQDLEKRGYSTSYILRPKGIENSANHELLSPSSFVIDKFHRFEGDSNPSDMSIIFAISTDDGDKGILIDAYGTYEDPLESEMLHKLRMAKP